MQCLCKLLQIESCMITHGTQTCFLLLVLSSTTQKEILMKIGDETSEKDVIFADRILFTSSLLVIFVMCM